MGVGVDDPGDQLQSGAILTIGISETLCDPGHEARINTGGHRKGRIRRGSEREGQTSGGQVAVREQMARNGNRVDLPQLQQLSSYQKLGGSDGGVLDGWNSQGSQGRGLGLVFPNTILTVAMPTPTVAVLQATMGPINTIRPKTMVLLPARCWDEYDLSTDQLVIASISMEIHLLSHFTEKTIDQG